MKSKLTSREKLFLFELSNDISQDIQAPHYNNKFFEDDITPEEFKAMREDKQLMKHFLISFWHNCETQLKRHQQRLKMIQSWNEQVKETILVDLYNSDKEIEAFYQPIRPIVVGLMDKYFADKHYFNTHESEKDLDKLRTKIDEDTYLAYEAFQELINGERDIRQCAAEDCDSAFNPKLKNQIYHSDKCRKRMWARKNKY
jgi:hypothetical protein